MLHTHDVTSVITAAEGQGEEGVEDGGIMADMDPLNDMYENLPPIEKLERYFQSEDILDRYVYRYTHVHHRI